MHSVFINGMGVPNKLTLDPNTLVMHRGGGLDSHEQSSPLPANIRVKFPSKIRVNLIKGGAKFTTKKIYACRCKSQRSGGVSVFLHILLYPGSSR